MSLVSCRDYTEQTCILTPGDHPFVKHEAAVYYRVIRRDPKGRLDSLCRSGELDMQAPMPPDVLARIRGGMLQSPMVSQELHDLLVCQGLQDDQFGGNP